MNPKSTRTTVVATAALLLLATLIGCSPENIFFEIANRSGGRLHNIKLTHCEAPRMGLPDGDLEIDSLNDSTIQGNYGHFDGPGDLTISYTTESGNTYSTTGPHINGNESGKVNVEIDGSRATFRTQFEGTQQQ
jgi:hypothetical protein